MKKDFSLLCLWMFGVLGTTNPLHAAPVRKAGYEPAVVAQFATPQQSVFLNAKCIASGSRDKQSPELAINGNKSPDDAWSCDNLPVWHQVELAAPSKINRLRVWPYWGDGRVYQYKVEGSADGKSWSMLGDKTANSITASAEGDLFTFPAQEVRFVRTTFLNNSLGNAKGGALVEIEGYAENSALAALRGGIGTTDERYAPGGPLDQLGLAPAESGIKLSAWRGERVNAQVVVSAGSNQTNLHVEACTLRGNGAVPVQANFVRYTLADGKPQGDILDTAESLPLAEGANRPVWLTVDVPADAQPGNYTGKVTVRSNEGAVEFPVSLEVLAATLPAPADWQCHLDLWQHPAAVARWHDVPEWSVEHFALLKPAMKRLADAGQKTITTTLIEEAWGGQTYDAFPTMVKWTKKPDGSWNYDYRMFDQWVSFMINDVGMKNARIHCYTMIPWSLKFRYFDEAKQADVDAIMKPGTPEYDEFWGRFLKDFVVHLKSKGWLERTRIGMDERPDALMRGAIATLHKHAPELKIASAINQTSALSREVDDVSPTIEHTGEFSRQDLDGRRAAGMKTTFYVCTVPRVPNNFTFSPPAESEWMGLYAAAQHLDGFLRWAYHSWVENPLVSTDFTSWPSGDCFLVYPGNRSSVRFERLRDGIEDFEKVRLLREWAQQGAPGAEQKKALDEMEEVLKRFTWERGQHSGVHADDVRQAVHAIEAAAKAVK